VMHARRTKSARAIAADHCSQRSAPPILPCLGIREIRAKTAPQAVSRRTTTQSHLPLYWTA
jgi:hypothetical protein